MFSNTSSEAANLFPHKPRLMARGGPWSPLTDQEGNRAAATRILEELKTRPLDGHTALNLAVLYGALGDKDQAFASLQKAFHERIPRLVRLGTEPQFDTLPADPRVKSLLRRMNLRQ